ncbi:MAG: hypothetical protein PHT69_13660 [Bacteroidales bacterium]|nr:hypothetical protein [Bacteroidales bacterium]
MNTKQPQSILSNLFQNKTQAITTEILFLFMAGVFGAVIQHYLKMPMQLPGKQGLLFMLILSSCASISRIKGSATITTSGAAAYFLIFQMASGDIFKPILFLLVGICFDAFIYLWNKFNKPLILLAVAGALSWAVIPFGRIFISLFTGIMYKSFISGILYPIATHLLFGFTASLIAGLTLKKFYK